ncbi:hypothetical protein THRCLA_01061 [Thraustotheca clavata]|uniref:Uncharacterized protein n=1 Tax=Thraustotheca clavata TaxID=74557 RepID=A0A1W0A9Q5_9STRA|nr:hypothetical protein THRCLA_01061 [Thraustotheca clavata]
MNNSRTTERKSVAMPGEINIPKAAVSPRSGSMKPRVLNPPSPSAIPKPRPSTVSSYIQRGSTVQQEITKKKASYTRQATVPAAIKLEAEESNKSKLVHRKSTGTALVLSTKRPIEAAANIALKTSPRAKTNPIDVQLKAENDQLQQQLHEKEKIIQEFNLACARYKGDCEAVAATALSWKQKYECLAKEMKEHAAEKEVKIATNSPPKMVHRRGSSAVLLRANAAWEKAVESLETHFDDAETLIQTFKSSDVETPYRKSSIAAIDTVNAIDTKLQRMPLQLEDDSMASIQDYERQLYTLKKELQAVRDYLQTDSLSCKELEQEFQNYKVVTEEKLNQSHNELQSLRNKLLGLAKSHCEQMSEAVARMNVLEDTIESIQTKKDLPQQERIASYEEAHAAFQNQLNTLQTNVASISKEKAKLAEECSALIDQLSMERGAAQLVIDALKEALEQQSLSTQMFTDTSTDKDTQIVELENSSTDKGSQIAELEKALEECNDESENLQSQVDGFERQLTSLRAQKHHDKVAADAERLVLHQEKDELESSLHEAREKAQELQKHVLSLTARYEQVQVNATQLEATLDAQQAHITALERTKATMSTKMAQLERALSLAEKQSHHPIHEEMNRLKQHNTALSQLLGRHEAMLASAQTEIGGLQSKIEQFELQQVEYAQYKHEVEAIEEILEASSPLHGPLIESLHSFAPKFSPSKVDLLQQEQIEMWRERCHALEGTNTLLLNKLREKEEPDMQFYVAQVDSLEERLSVQAAQYQLALQEAQARIHQLEETLSKKVD